jgi:D-lyxose ketol-isomerase
MKRSEINAAIDAGRRVLEKIHFKLPDFESWTLDEWKRMRPQIDEIVKTGMGWDVTDFGSNDFVNIGATIFTIRNGYAYDSTVGVPYAEKIIIMTEGQTIPLHFHFKKTEDIINRGNGVLCVQLYNSLSDESLDKNSRPRVKCDGRWREFAPGDILELLPGSSITMRPNLYHAFWAKKGEGTLVCGEVSSINDDNVDNRFHSPMPRYAEIEEDQPPRYVLCNEYEKLLG